MPPARPDHQPPNGGHVVALDGLRAVAIALVFGVHTFVFFEEPTLGTRLVNGVLQFGWMGVDLFFVLSGMLITGILLDTKGAPGYYRSFYARRSLRIFPLYYAALLILMIAVPAVGGWWAGRPPQFHGHQGWLWTYTANVHMAATNSWDALTPLTFPFWSLAVEEQFYLVWPLVVARLSTRALARVAGAMAGVALLLRVAGVLSGDGHEVGVYVSTLTRMDALAAGALLAIAIRSPGGLARYRRFAAPVFAGSAAALAALFALARTNRHEHPLVATLGLSLIALASTAILARVLTDAPGTRLRRALEGRLAQHVGARSYGIYVWHVAVFGGLAALGVVQRLTAVISFAVVRGLLASALGAAAVLAAANLSWVVIERPFLRLKRLVPRPATSPAPAPRSRRPAPPPAPAHRGA